MGSILIIIGHFVFLFATLAGAGNVSLPSYALAVKSPYLSAWVPGNQIGNAASASPQFWNGINLTWPLLARVNGKTYSLFGNSQGIGNTVAASTISVKYSASHTYIQLQAGLCNFNLDFFSPVLPGKNEYASQSLPYSYLTVNVTAQTSVPIEVQILTGVDQTWTAQKGSSVINYAHFGSAGFFWFQNPHEIPFTEVNDMATYGSFLFATKTGATIKHGCGPISSVVEVFAKRGSISSSKFCSPNDFVAFSKSLVVGENSGRTSSVTFAVGYDRTKVINYLGVPRTGYHRTQWSTIPEAVDHVLEDYQTLLSRSLSFDAEIRSRSEAVSHRFGCQYADVVEASVRQTFGGMELTVRIPQTHIRS